LPNLQTGNSVTNHYKPTGTDVWELFYNDWGWILANCLAMLIANKICLACCVLRKNFMKRRSFYTILAAAAAVLLLIGLSGFAWLFSQSPLSLLGGTKTPNPQSIIFVPKQSPAMASLMVSPDRLEALQLALATPDHRKAQRAEFAALRDGLLGEGLSYQRDVQPWLGNEVTLAVTTLDIDRDSSNGNQPGYLMAVTTQDSTRSREFLQLFWQKRALNQDLTFDNFKGTQIIYGSVNRPNQTDAPPITLASAVVGNRFVLFANSPKVLRDAINDVQAAELNLSNDTDYQTAIAALSPKRIGLAYLNFPQLAALSGDLKGLENLPAEAYRSMGVGFGLDRQGLVANTALLGNTATIAQLSQPSSGLKYLPSVTPISFSGNHLDQFTSHLTQGIAPYKLATSLFQQPLQNWGKQWNLDLSQDIFAWAQGNYAFGLLPQKNQATDWIFVVDKASSPDFQQGLSKLDDRAHQQGLTTGQVQVAGQPVSAWTKLASEGNSTDLKAKAIGAWTEIDQSVILASSIEAMEQALTASKRSLLQSHQFGQAISRLDRNNNGYLYLDWPTTKPILAKQLPIVQILDLVAQPLIKNLKSITISSYGGQNNLTRGSLFFRL
jgi:hypothetical protein